MAKPEGLRVEGLTIVIQAGGSSTRIGKDKGLILFQEVPLVKYILHQVQGLADEVILISNQPRRYRDVGFVVYRDVYPGRGALGGLYSAIYHAREETCLVLACDMPFVNRSLIKYMIDLAPGFDAVVPKLDIGDYFEPFRAVYRKSCLGPIEAALDRGKQRVISFFDDVNVRIVKRVEIERFDPESRSFININTAEDLERAELLVSEDQKKDTGSGGV